MSVFSKMKHGLEHAGGTIKGGFDKAGDGIRHVADKAGDDFATAAERIAAEAKKDLAAVEKEAMSVLDDIKHELSKVADGIKDGFEKVGDEIKADFEKTADTITHGLEEAFNEATGAVKQIPQDVASEAVKARNALDGVSKELLADLSKAGEAIKEEAEKGPPGPQGGIRTDRRGHRGLAVLRRGQEGAGEGAQAHLVAGRQVERIREVQPRVDRPTQRGVGLHRDRADQAQLRQFLHPDRGSRGRRSRKRLGPVRST